MPAVCRVALELSAEAGVGHAAALADGTVVGRALTQLGDTAEGFTAHLTVYVPVTCPPEVPEHHLRHYAVEFRNWIAAAGTARS